MDVSDEYRLVVAIENEEKIEILESRASLADQKLRALIETNKALGGGAASANAAIQAQAAVVNKLRTELEGAEKAMRTFDVAGRAGAKARLGLAGANIAQDVIQGGSPAYAINNILGLAGDKAAVSMIGEWVAAAGGIGAVAAGGAIALAGLAAGFVAIDQGLKAAKLDWSDFDDVLANLAPINAAGEAFSGLGTLVSDTATTIIDTLGGKGTAAVLGEYWSSIFDTIGSGFGSAIGFVDEYTIGWGRATDAAKVHKDEVDRAVASARAYGEAVKELGKFQSAEQKQQEANAKTAGQELANLGGAGGIEGLAATLAEKATRKGADDKVKIQEETKDKHGKGTGEFEEKEVTRREAARRDILAQLNRAREGDPNAIGDVAQRLKGAGLDPSGFLDATKGIDRKALADAESDRVWEESQESIKAMRDARKKRAKAATDDAKLMASTGDAEELALKRQHDAAEPGRKEAEKRDRERERADRAYQDKLADAPGLDEYVRDQLFAGAPEEAVAGQLAGLGFGGEKIGDLLDRGAKAGFEKMLGESGKVSNSQTLSGGAALKDAIQGGVSNQDLGKQQLDRLTAAVGYLQRIADQRPDYTARVT